MHLTTIMTHYQETGMDDGRRQKVEPPRVQDGNNNCLKDFKGMKLDSQSDSFIVVGSLFEILSPAT